MSNYDGTWEIETASARASTPGSAREILVTVHDGEHQISIRPTPLQALGLAQLLTGVAMAALENSEIE